MMSCSGSGSRRAAGPSWMESLQSSSHPAGLGVWVVSTHQPSSRAFIVSGGAESPETAMKALRARVQSSSETEWNVNSANR